MTETTITQDAIVAFSQDVTALTSLEPLGVSPCAALEATFPAIAGDPLVLEALAMMLEPAVDEVAHVVAIGGVERDAGENFLHNVFHLLQLSAAMGHALGVAQAMGPVDVDDIPDTLEDIVWSDLPDFTGDDSPEES